MSYKNHILALFAVIIIALVVSACSQDVDYKSQAEKDFDYDASDVDDLDPDDPDTDKIKEGKKIFYETNTELEDNVGSEQSCMSCHASDNLNGTQPLEGVTEKFPSFRARDAAIATIEDRINGCMVRSMNGEELDKDSHEMEAMVAYLEFISEDFEGADEEDMPWLEETDMEEVPEPNVERGELLFDDKNCMSCHADDGKGRGPNHGPPLWGEDSFNDGAGMSRVSKITGFIQKYMPLDDAGSLSDQEAADIAAYLLSLERPEWDDHESDWPEGGRPDDIITKKEREQIQNGTFDWKELDVIK